MAVMRRVGGGVLVVVGVFIGVGVLLNVGEAEGAGAVVVALLVFGVVPIVVGWRLLKGPRAGAARALAAGRAWDSELLRLAARRDGCLSVAEVVAHADLGAAEAEQRLDELSRRGLCEVRVTDAGVLVYRFERLPSGVEKRAAVGVLDE